MTNAVNDTRNMPTNCEKKKRRAVMASEGLSITRGRVRGRVSGRGGVEVGFRSGAELGLGAGLGLRLRFGLGLG
jgi:hypothetical protein